MKKFAFVFLSLISLLGLLFYLTTLKGGVSPQDNSISSGWKNEKLPDLKISMDIPQSWIVEADHEKSNMYWVGVDTNSKEFQAVIGGGADNPELTVNDGFSIELSPKLNLVKDSEVLKVGKYSLTSITEKSYQLDSPNGQLTYVISFSGYDIGEVALKVISTFIFDL